MGMCLALVAPFQPFRKIRGAPQEPGIAAHFKMRNSIIDGSALLPNPAGTDLPSVSQSLAVDDFEFS